MHPSIPAPYHPASGAGRLERFAQRATAWAERWMPDAFVFALGATFVVLAAAILVDPDVRQAPFRLVDAWGNGFWSLITFTLQMAMIIVSGYVLASSPPVFRLLARLAQWPRSPKGAVVLVALVAMLTALINWGFSLIVSAVLAREVARRVPEADYRALGASSFLGLGTVWAQGLSGSAALQMARASSMPPALAQMVGEIPLSATIFRWQSLACTFIEIIVVAFVVWRIAPGEGRGRTAAALGIDLTPPHSSAVARPVRRSAEREGEGAEAKSVTPMRGLTPGERMEHSAALLVPIALLGFVYLARAIAMRASSLTDALNALDLNTVNLFFLMLGALLHRTPASLMQAMKEATPATWGVLLQFPFYAGIFGVMTGTALSDALANVFVRVSTATFFPAVILTYSAVLNLFVPSGGAKWLIEAPYVLRSAGALGVDSGWMVITYGLGDSVTNLIQPFWMLPILALLGLRARDIMGYTYLIALVLFPLELILVTIFRP